MPPDPITEWELTCLVPPGTDGIQNYPKIIARLKGDTIHGDIYSTV